jgi:hypothetical protein
VRTIELLLGLPPMSQYDAAATPLYAAFDMVTDLKPYTHVQPEINVNEKNTGKSYGAQAARRMDFDNVDRAPMFTLNEILWKSIKGADSPMPFAHSSISFLAVAAGQQRIRCERISL